MTRLTIDRLNEQIEHVGLEAWKEGSRTVVSRERFAHSEVWRVAQHSDFRHRNYFYGFEREFSSNAAALKWFEKLTPAALEKEILAFQGEDR